MNSLEQVGYEDRGTALIGWLARPTGAARGAIVIYPTIANVTPPMERRAELLADAGFVAMIADFYGEPITSFEASRPFGDKLRADVDHYRTRTSAAINTLAAHPAAKGLRMAATGYCMGGQAALEMARMGQPLELAASFHGILATDRPATAETPISARLLICHGDADPMVPREQVMAFWQEMDAAQANWHFHSYAGVKHGFTDPGSEDRGMAALGYDASADRQSWAALMELLDEIFAKKPA